MLECAENRDLDASTEASEVGRCASLALFLLLSGERRTWEAAVVRGGSLVPAVSWDGVRSLGAEVDTRGGGRLGKGTW